MTKIMKENSRSFTVVSSSFGLPGGRYIDDQPLKAARKAGRKQFEKADAARLSSKNNMVVYIELNETTKTQKVEHPKERYFYKVTRVAIPKSEQKSYIFKQKDGKKVTVTPEFDYEVSAVDKDSFPADHRG